MRVYGYIRVSGDSQLDGDGPLRQGAKIEGFCKSFGLELKQVFDEKSLTGTTEWSNREEFSKLLDRAKTDGVDAVVVERLDRLARDLMISEFIIRELKARGLQLFAADQGLVDQVNAAGDPTRTLIRQILSALSQWERSMIVAKLAGARARKKAETGRCEGQKPYGDLPGEEITLRLILQMRKAGASYREIADHLHYDCARLTRNGKAWTSRHVRRILNNRVDTSS